MKGKIRRWLRDFLGLTRFEYKVEHRLKQFDKLVKVGIDWHYRDESWAVICIAGSPEYVQFARLKSNEARELLHMLQGMKAREWAYTIDVPMSFRKALLDELV